MLLMQSLSWGRTPLASSGTFFHSHTAASGVDHQMLSYGWFWIRKTWYIGIEFLKWLMRDFCSFRSYNYIYNLRPFQAYRQSTSSSKCPLFSYNAASSWALKPVADSHGLLAICLLKMFHFGCSAPNFKNCAKIFFCQFPRQYMGCVCRMFSWKRTFCSAWRRDKAPERPYFDTSVLGGGLWNRWGRMC